MTGGTSLDESQSDWWLQHRHRVSHHRILDPSYYNNTRGQTVKPKSQEICPSPLSTRVCVRVKETSDFRKSIHLPAWRTSSFYVRFFLWRLLSHRICWCWLPLFVFTTLEGKQGWEKTCFKPRCGILKVAKRFFTMIGKLLFFLQSIPPPVLAPCLWKTIKIFADMSAVRSAKCCLLPRGIRFQFLKCFYGYRRTHYLEWWWCRPAAED